MCIDFVSGRKERKRERGGLVLNFDWDSGRRYIRTRLLLFLFDSRAGIRVTRNFQERFFFFFFCIYSRDMPLLGFI